MSHFAASAWTPKEWFGHFNKISWSRVSKAAERSNKIRTAILPLSRASVISVCTFSKAVSVEWAFLYADW